MPASGGTLAAAARRGGFDGATPSERARRRAVGLRARPARRAGHRHAARRRARCYLPLIGSRGTVGVLGVASGAIARRLTSPEQRHLLETLRRPDRAGARARQARRRGRSRRSVRVEAERLRSSLLSSVSHDLRTPLAVITGAASSAARRRARASTPADAARAAATTVHEEAERLNRLVGEPARHDAARVGRAAARQASGSRSRRSSARRSRAWPSGCGDRRDRHRACRADLPLVRDRRRAHRAGAGQPARERAQVHAGRQPDRDQRAAATDQRRSPSRSPTAGPGFPPGDEDADLREVPPRPQPGARARRRARARDLPGDRRGARRAHRGAATARAAAPRSASRCRCGERRRRPPSAPTRVNRMSAPIRSSWSSRTSRRSAASCARRSRARATALLEAGTGADGLREAADAAARPRPPRPRPARRRRPRGDAAPARVDARCRSSCSRRAARRATRSRRSTPGADDYLTKPFGVGELLARMRVALRHAARRRDERRARCSRSASCGRSRAPARARVDGREVHLTPIEYKLLADAGRGTPARC